MPPTRYVSGRNAYCVGDQIAKPVTQLRGRTLLTDPEVFHPVYFLSTPLFLDYLSDYLSTIAVAGKRLLDMGTGSGVVGIFAARLATRSNSKSLLKLGIAISDVGEHESAI